MNYVSACVQMVNYLRVAEKIEDLTEYDIKMVIYPLFLLPWRWSSIIFHLDQHLMQKLWQIIDACVSVLNYCQIMFLHILSLERYCPPVWCLKHLLISLSCKEGHGNASWEIIFHQNLKCFKRDWNDSTPHTMKWDSIAFNESTKLKLQSPVYVVRFNNYLKCMNWIREPVKKKSVENWGGEVWTRSFSTFFKMFKMYFKPF